MLKLLQHLLMLAMLVGVMTIDAYIKATGSTFNLPWFLLGGLLGIYWMDIHYFFFGKKRGGPLED